MSGERVCRRSGDGLACRQARHYAVRVSTNQRSSAHAAVRQTSGQSVLPIDEPIGRRLALYGSGGCQVLKLLTRTLFALALLQGVAGAQTVASPSKTVDPFGTGRLAFAPAEQPTALPHRKDSLWNGVLVGAGLGALVGIAGSPLISDARSARASTFPSRLACWEQASAPASGPASTPYATRRHLIVRTCR